MTYDWYQIILIGDRDTCEQLAQGRYQTAEQFYSIISASIIAFNGMSYFFILRKV